MKQLGLVFCALIFAGLVFAGWQEKHDYAFCAAASSTNSAPAPWGDDYCIANDAMSQNASAGLAGSFTNGDFTVSLWVKRQDWGETPPDGYFAIFYAWNNTFWTFYDGGSGDNWVPFMQGHFSSIPLTNNAWMHWAITRSGTVSSLYVNGSRTSSQTNSVQTIDSDGCTYFGGFNGSQLGNTYLDEIAMWTRALSDSEMATVYTTYGNTNTAPWSSGLRAAWHCSEGSGTSLTDYSGNGFTMDLGGMSWVEDSPR